MSGLCCAIAETRHGVKVMLIHDCSVLRQALGTAVAQAMNDCVILENIDIKKTQ